MSRVFKKFYTLQMRDSNVVYIIQYYLKWSFIEYGEQEINARDRPTCLWVSARVRLSVFLFPFWMCNCMEKVFTDISV